MLFILLLKIREPKQFQTVLHNLEWATIIKSMDNIKERKKNEGNNTELQKNVNAIKHTNIHVMGVPK